MLLQAVEYRERLKVTATMEMVLAVIQEKPFFVTVILKSCEEKNLCSLSSAHAAVRELVRRKWVRVKRTKKDGRLKLIQISESGRQYIKKMKELWNE
jgi:hypothetical protein